MSNDNNAAERGMRGIAVGRKNYLFMGSDKGGKSAAIAYTLIETAKLNGVDPQAWLTDVLSRIADCEQQSQIFASHLFICGSVLFRTWGIVVGAVNNNIFQQAKDAGHE